MLLGVIFAITARYNRGESFNAFVVLLKTLNDPPHFLGTCWTFFGVSLVVMEAKCQAVDTFLASFL